MREIEASEITKAVARLAQKANFELGEDVLEALKKAREREQSPIGRETLDRLLENAGGSRTVAGTVFCGT